MSAIRELLQQIPDPSLSNSERVRLRCKLAKQFEKTGNYEAACRALGNVWPGVGKSPNLDTLDERTSGELLLRVGVLSGWIGSMRLIKGSQESAKSLIGESIPIFESLPDVKKVAEAQTEIGLCCAREGALERARIVYADALARLDDNDGDLKALAVLRSAMVELMASRVNDALNILAPAAGLFESSNNDVLRGCFHNEFAKALKSVGIAENRPDYMECALNEYSSASFYFEKAGHARYQGAVENNMALLLVQFKRFAAAHEHLDRALALYTHLGDNAYLAGLEDTRARVFLAEENFAQAEKVAFTAIQMFEKSDEHSHLAEALTTRGVALAYLHHCERARACFERAIEVAEQAGDFEKAGRAALSLVELLAEQLTQDELCGVLELARRCLGDTQHEELRKRLTACAYRALSLIHAARPDWSNFTLDGTLLRHEARFIQMALEDSGGSVTKAAELLGLPGHQSLNFILNRRHPQLLASRTPVRPRRRSIMKK